MNILQKGMVVLIYSGLTGERMPLPEGFDLEEAYPQLVRHQVTPLCYVGAVNCGVDKSLPVMRKLFQSYCRSMQHSEGQMKAVEAVCAAFDAGQVDYMCLKGSRLKKLYPKPELRLMGDADILIRTGQYDRIRPIMLELGFTEKLESNHELVWRRKELELELHKRLIPSYNKDYYRYFGDGWQLAKVKKGTNYEMTREDEYIYLFTHFAKHYRDGGIGCRHLVDLWVYRKACPGMDEAYIAGELEKLQLLEFEQNIRRVTEVWFENVPGDDKTDFITDFLFSSGAWGSAENHLVSAGVRSASDAGSVTKGRIKRVWTAVFPSAEALQNRYPVLRKHPGLLPLIWPVRLVTAGLFRRNDIRKSCDNLSAATTDKIKTYQDALHYVGLDFNFRE